MQQRFKQVLSSPASWFFAAVWILSLIYLLSTGNGVTGSVAFAAGILVFCAITVAMTEEQTEGTENVASGNARSPLFWAQIVVIFFFILLTGYRGFVFNLHPGSSINIPIWSFFGDWAANLGGRYLSGVVDHSPGIAAANFVGYFLIPFIFLLLLGARPSMLGFGKGHRVWRVTAAWAGIPLIFFLLNISTGSVTVVRLAQMFMGNLLRNGFSEEFLFRGALQTRLEKWMSSDWALVLQALIFAIWHLGADTQVMGGDVLQGLALGLASHSIFGLAVGIIFRRTRNLIAPSIVHVVINMFGS